MRAKKLRKGKENMPMFYVLSDPLIKGLTKVTFKE